MSSIAHKQASAAPTGTAKNFNLRAFLAGGGFRGGTTHGATDDYGYKVVSNRVEIYDPEGEPTRLV